MSGSPYVSEADAGGPHHMETFDLALGLLEVVLVASSAAVLVAAARRDGRRIRVAALVLPAITAVTVAHPYGVMALERAGPPPPLARPPVDPASTHRFSTLGVPGSRRSRSTRETSST